MAKTKDRSQTEPPGEPERPLPLFAMVDLKSPPLDLGTRDQCLVLLLMVRNGELPPSPLSEPMPSLGHNVHEIRLSDRKGEWRFIYAIRSDHVLLIDAFQKKTQKTSKPDRERAKNRLRQHDATLAAREAARRKAEKRQGKPKESP